MVEAGMAKIAVLGHGVVGSGVVELLEQNRQSIAAKAGQQIEIKYILDIRDFDELPYRGKFTKDFDQILNDEEITVVAEVMGGLSPAYEYGKALLERRKSVVTSNKELVAAKGGELLRIAREHNCNFFFEASVGGGIPIIRPLHQCLAANEIREIAGILNGTTNFILTKMVREGMAFSKALKMAQELGYAERNPAADVEGTDACRKICILASLAWGRQVDPASVYTEGISGLTPEDMAYARSWGGVVKLIGRAKRLEDGGLTVTVFPALLSRESQLANIDDVFNGILVRGNAAGDLVFYGRGAGKLPTASAVAADIIEAVQETSTCPTLNWEEAPPVRVADHREVPYGFYLRICASDAKQTAERLRSRIPGLQLLSRPSQPEYELAAVTPPQCESQLEKTLDKILDTGDRLMGKIRVLED